MVFHRRSIHPTIGAEMNTGGRWVTLILEDL